MAEVFYNERRIDGRRTNELRRVFCQFELGNSDGIVQFHQGNTRVMASVVGPHPCRHKGDRLNDRAVIICKYSKPPFSSTSGERRKVSQKDRSTNDFATAIEEIFACVVRTEKYQMSQIDIFLEVLQSDGSEFACAVNAATMALSEAGIEMHNLACAASVGFWGSHVFADLCRFEENPRIPQLTMVCLQKTENSKRMVPPPQVLHTRLSSWLPAEKLHTLCAAAARVAQTVGEEMACWLRGRIRQCTVDSSR